MRRGVGVLARALPRLRVFRLGSTQKIFRRIRSTKSSPEHNELVRNFYKFRSQSLNITILGTKIPRILPPLALILFPTTGFSVYYLEKGATERSFRGLATFNVGTVILNTVIVVSFLVSMQMLAKRWAARQTARYFERFVATIRTQQTSQSLLALRNTLISQAKRNCLSRGLMLGFPFIIQYGIIFPLAQGYFDPATSALAHSSTNVAYMALFYTVLKTTPFTFFPCFISIVVSQFFINSLFAPFVFLRDNV